MKRPCAWCDADYEARTPKQRCCSRSCAQLMRQHEARQQRGYQPANPVGWRQRPTSNEGRDHAQAKLRQELLPLAVGRGVPDVRTGHARDATAGAGPSGADRQGWADDEVQLQDRSLSL